MTLHRRVIGLVAGAAVLAALSAGPIMGAFQADAGTSELVAPPAPVSDQASAEAAISAAGRPLQAGSAGRTVGDSYSVWSYLTADRGREHMLVRADGQPTAFLGCRVSADLVRICGTQAGGGGPVVITGASGAEVAAVRAVMPDGTAVRGALGPGGWLIEIPAADPQSVAPERIEALDDGSRVLASTDADPVRTLLRSLGGR